MGSLSLFFFYRSARHFFSLLQPGPISESRNLCRVTQSQNTRPFFPFSTNTSREFFFLAPKAGNLFAGFKGQGGKRFQALFRGAFLYSLGLFLFCLTSVVSRRTRRLFVTLLTDVSRRVPPAEALSQVIFFQTTA